MSPTRLCILLLGLTWISACTGTSSPSGAYPGERPIPATVTRVTPDPTAGRVAGKVINLPAHWSGKEISIYPAEFHGDSEGKGFYFVDPARHPHAILRADGSFEIMNVRPGEYVLVLGPGLDNAVAVREGEKTQIYRVSVNQTTDTGTIDMEQ